MHKYIQICIIQTLSNNLIVYTCVFMCLNKIHFFSIFPTVIRCLQNGVNFMHIEDQYTLKRCGHLGGKGLDDLHGYIITVSIYIFVYEYSIV